MTGNRCGQTRQKETEKPSVTQSGSAAKRNGQAHWSRLTVGTVVAGLGALLSAGCAHTKELQTGSISPEPPPSASAPVHTAATELGEVASASAVVAHAPVEPATHSARSAGPANTSTKSWINARASIWVPTLDAMAEHLAQVDRAKADRDGPRAARQLRDAAAVLKQEGAAAGAISALNATATRVERGDWPSKDAYAKLLIEANRADPQHGWGQRISYSRYAEAPLRALRRAERAYRQRDFEGARVALREAADDVRREADRATDSARAALWASVDELTTAARQLKQSTGQGRSEIDVAATATLRALAEHHYLLARAFWARKAKAATGRELEAATLYLRKGAGKALAVDQKVVDRVRELAQKLVSHENVAASRVREELRSLRAEIDKVQPA